MKLFVSIIIVTYNREESLRRVLTSVFQQKYPHFETILVDQTPHHSAETKKFLKNAGPRVQIIHQSKPSITKARNKGLQKAKGDIVLYIDDDVKLPADFIEKHVQNYQNPNITGVTGKIVEAEPVPLVHTCKDQEKDWWRITFLHEKRGPIARVAGGNMSFRTKALQEIGGFDEMFTDTAWGEETDVSFRLRKKGATLWFDPEIEVTHFSTPEGGTRTSQKDITLNQSLYQNQMYFYRKHLKWRDIPKFLLLSYRYFVWRKPVRGKILKRHKAFFTGLLKGARLSRHA